MNDVRRDAETIGVRQYKGGKTMTRLTTAAAVLIAVLSLATPVDVNAQTRAERDAFNNLARAVRAAQSNTSPQRLGDVRLALERAYSVFQNQERRREAADGAYHATYDDRIDTVEEAQQVGRTGARYAELLGQSTAAHRARSRRAPQMYEGDGNWQYSREGMITCERSYRQCREIESTLVEAFEAHMRDSAVHLRYLYAAGEAMVEAANGLEDLAPRFIGFDVRHNAMLQRLGSAKLAAIQNQGRVLLDASACEAGHSCTGEVIGDFDQSLQGLVDAAVAVADGLASYASDQQRANAELEAASVPPPLAGAGDPTLEQPATIEGRIGTDAPAVEAGGGAPPPGAGGGGETPGPSSPREWLETVTNLLAEVEGYVAAAAETDDSVRCWNVAHAQNMASSRLFSLVSGTARPQFIPAEIAGQAREQLREREQAAQNQVREICANKPLP